MVAPVISISFEESVGSHVPRVILFSVIPTIIPVIPEVPIVLVDPLVAPDVGTVLVVSPAGVLDLLDYSSSSDSDPSEDSLPHIPDLPLVSPSGSTSHDTFSPSSEFPLPPIVASPVIRRRSATLARPGKAIPFGRPYQPHSNGPHSLLTAGKRVRPIPARRLAWRRVSHHSSDRHFSPDSPSSSSLSYHSLSGHTPPDTTDADSATPQRFVHHHMLGLHDVVTLLDVGAPTPTDLLPPCKRFSYLYSSEDSKEEHMEVDIADAEAVANVGISDGVVAHTEDGVGMGVEVTTSDVREHDEEFKVEASAADTREIIVDPLAIGDSFVSSKGGIHDLEDTIYDIVHYMSEVRIDRITKIKTTQR
ncbi:hypothetical protein Tco_1007773, partial [Tanacetum coccineum]